MDTNNVFLVIKCKNETILEKIREDVIKKEEDVFSLGEKTDADDLGWPGNDFSPTNSTSTMESVIDDEENFNVNDEIGDFEPSVSKDSALRDIFAEVKKEPLDVDEEEEEKKGSVSALNFFEGLNEKNDNNLDFNSKLTQNPPLPLIEKKENLSLANDVPKPIQLTDGSFTQKCRLCVKNIIFMPQVEWSVKCKHAFSHIFNVSYLCPYCFHEAGSFKIRNKIYKYLPALYKHITFVHNKEQQSLILPACRDENDTNQLLKAMEECFPLTEIQSLDLPLPGLFSAVARRIMRYYVIFWKEGEDIKFPVQITPKRIVKVVCTKCRTSISRGPMEEFLKFEHALTHSDIKWIICTHARCMDRFSDKESFSQHSSEKHSGNIKYSLRDRDLLTPAEVKIVQMLVNLYFPSYSVEELIREANGPSVNQRKSINPQRKIEEITSDNSQISSLFGGNQEAEIKEEEDPPVMRRRTKRKAVFCAPLEAIGYFATNGECGADKSNHFPTILNHSQKLPI